MVNLVEIGRNVQYYRRELQKSQSDLAYAASISDKLLSEIERGKANPSALNLISLAGAIGIELEDLVRKEHGIEFLKSKNDISRLQPLLEQIPFAIQVLIIETWEGLLIGMNQYTKNTENLMRLIQDLEKTLENSDGEQAQIMSP